MLPDVGPTTNISDRGDFGEEVEVPLQARYIARPRYERVFPRGATRHGTVVQLARRTVLQGEVDVQSAQPVAVTSLSQIGWSSFVALKRDGTFECVAPRNTRTTIAVWLDDACVFLPIVVPDKETADVGSCPWNPLMRNVILDLEIDARGIHDDVSLRGFQFGYYGIVLVRDDLRVGYYVGMDSTGSGITSTHRKLPDGGEGATSHCTREVLCRCSRG